MAKKQRGKTRVVARARTAGSKPKPEPQRPLVRVAPPPSPVERPEHRPEYYEAVALYEQGVAALQAHDYSRASSLLRSVLARYPEEKQLHERVRLYINVCDRHMAPGAAAPSTPEERVFAATLALNSGDLDQALEHLRTATTELPDYDHAMYMMASVLALKEDIDEAVSVLLRAIDLNPDNRSMARHDPDLEPLRQRDSVRAALEAPAPPKPERRKSLRRAR